MLKATMGLAGSVLAMAILAMPASAGLLGDVGDTVNDTVNDVGDTVNDTVNDVVDEVDNTVNEVSNTVDETVGGVTDTVDGLTGDVPDTGGLFPLPDGGDPGDLPFLVGNGGGGAAGLPAGMIAQLQQLIEIIRAREWVDYDAYGLGRRPRVGAVDLRQWVPQSSWGDLNQVLIEFSADIMALQRSIQSGLVLPRWTGFRRLPITHVVAVDIVQEEGTVILYHS